MIPFSADELAIMQARQMMARPRDLAAWSGFWGSAGQPFLTHPVEQWSAVISAQLEIAYAYVDWLETLLPQCSAANQRTP
jgi:hypothetical protein